jgi:hypothetical protein
LTGPEKLYLPATPTEYRLVCFLSGERPLRAEFAQQGAAARLFELEVDEPLLPDLRRWRDFADTHYGWFGRELIEAEASDGLELVRGWLKRAYNLYRSLTDRWCGRGFKEHQRTVDFLAAVQFGYARAHRQLFGQPPKEAEAEVFGIEVYRRLSRDPQAAELLVALAQLPEAREAALRGFIPAQALDSLAGRFGRDGKAWRQFLVNAGVIKKAKAEPRKVDGRSERCCLLTDQARARLTELMGPAGTPGAPDERGPSPGAATDTTPA